MIAYMVQIHDSFQRAARLLSWISHPSNLYVVMVDCATPIPQSFTDNVSSLPNVHIIHDMPCMWGGASMVAETLKAMSLALSLSDRWASFVNISGSDVPLKSQEAMMQKLQEMRSEGRRSFIAEFDQCAFDPRIHVDETIGECTKILFRPNATFHVYGQARALFENLERSPITIPAQRLWISVYEAFSQKALHIRPLFAQEQKAREDFFCESPFRFGRQWMILDRALCERFCRSPAAVRSFEFLKSVLIPDECFFQTLLANPEFDTASIVRNDNLRFKLGGPHNLVDLDLEDLKKSGPFFARKLNESRAPNIIEWVWQNTGAIRPTAGSD